MRLYILLSIVVFSTPSIATEIAVPTLTKPSINMNALKRYNIHAQCARLAELAGRKAVSAEHLRTAKKLKPEEVADSDISYRYGFVDGRVANEVRRSEGKLSMARVAFNLLKTTCPASM